MHGTRRDIPDQCLRQIIDLALQRIKALMQRSGPLSFSAVQRFVAARKTFRLPPIDLATVTPPFIDDRRSQPRFNQRLRGAHARRPRADNHYTRGHTPSAASASLATTDMPRPA